MPPELSAAERSYEALEFAWDMVVDLWPYLVGGVVIAALVRQIIPARRLAGIAGRRGLVAVVVSAVLGIVSPLCTYGTIPILFQFCRSGGPVGPALAFAVASSLANPQVLALTYGALGPWMTGARVVASLCIAFGAGFVALRLKGADLLNRKALAEDAVLSPAPGHRHHTGSDQRFDGKKFIADCMDVGGFIGLYFLIGILVSGFTKYFVPREFLSSILRSYHWTGIVIATTLGAPFYACGGGSIPTVKFLIGNQLMDPGGGLAFLTAGPAMRLSCLAALAAFLSRRALVVYVAYVFVASLLFGLAFSVLTGAFPWMIQIEHVQRIPTY